ncbi:MAG: hypothetical protein ABSB79_00295 [Syntrophales bacterium]|jgi:hypothetical protein
MKNITAMRMILIEMLFFALTCFSLSVYGEEMKTEDTETYKQKDVNQGEDFTRPLNRFDVRYTTYNWSMDYNSGVFIFRTDMPFDLDGGWKFGFRADLPLVGSNVPAADNVQGDWKYGLGDILTQGMFIKTYDEKIAYGFGVQLIWPTASYDNMGLGKYVIMPGGGIRYFLPDLGKGSFFAPVVSYRFDYADNDKNRAHISELVLTPSFLIALPTYTFISFYPNPEIKLNLNDGGKLFLPLDVMIGQMFSRNIIGSMEISVPLIQDYKQYDAKVEFRVGYFF